MSVRRFSGSDSIVFDVGGGGVTGAVTIAALARPSQLSVSFITQGYNTSNTAAGYGLELGVLGRLGLYSGSDIYCTNALVALNRWQILAVSKAADSATARFHSCDVATGAWLRDNATARSADARATTGGTIRVGQWGGNYHYRGDLAAIAIWNSELSEATIETLATTGSLSGWAGVSAPVTLWLFDQASTATAVTDRIGSAHQRGAATGTAVLADDPPIPYVPSVRHYDGSGWSDRPFSHYNGSAWNPAPLRGVA